MNIEAKVIAASVAAGSNTPIYTLQLKYPRFIHSEFMTHRVFSRNASSSRAIPVKRQLELVTIEPAVPIYWGSNKAGMQAGEELEGPSLQRAKDEWYEARIECKAAARSMMEVGLHKQVANRILEPWQHIHVVVTATEWDNFFYLRDHEAAQPEIRELAKQMKKAIADSTLTTLHPNLENPWHLPYITPDDWSLWEKKELTTENLIAASVARCARVSYLNHDGSKCDINKDIELHDMLLKMKHMSPFEHVARPMDMPNSSQAIRGFAWDKGATHVDRNGQFWSGNFRHWVQYRQVL